MPSLCQLVIVKICQERFAVKMTCICTNHSRQKKKIMSFIIISLCVCDVCACAGSCECTHTMVHVWR